MVLTSLMLPRRKSQRGQILPFMALSMAILIGVSALAVDISVARLNQRRAQTAADSASIAAVNEIPYTTSLQVGDALVTLAAYADAQANGFSNGSNGVTVKIIAPSGVFNNANFYAAKVTITKNILAPLSGIFGIHYNQIYATATALAPKSQSCGLYVLTKQLMVNSTIQMPQCNIYANKSYTFNGSSSVTANQLTYAGSSTKDGVTNFTKPSIPNTVTADPCSSFVGCPQLVQDDAAGISPAILPTSNNGQSCMNKYQNGITVTTLSPCNYGSALITQGRTLNLLPGVYKFSSLNDNVGPVNVQGTNVTIICATCMLGNSVNFTLSAPTTPQANNPYVGVVFYDDGSGGDLNVNSTSVNSFTGLFYAPKMNINFDGGPTTVSTLVAGGVTLNANSSLQRAASSGTGSSIAGLAE